MSNTVIRVENLSKQYRLGTIGTGSLAHDINRWLHGLRGKEDPYLTIGDENDRTVKGNSEYIWALKDINFTVKHGEVLGIIGRNGAGKSTLLKILSRTTAPTTGQVKIKGRVASLLEVGTGFHPELTGRENVFLNGAIMGMTKAEIKRKFEEIVDFSGVERYIDTPVKRYSSGMYVRLAFAVAAHLDPEILIVDEVLAVGDADFQKKCLGKMKDVSTKEGRTVLFVSHNMTAVRELCDNAMILNNGKLTQPGETAKLIVQYIQTMQAVDLSSDELEKDEVLRRGNGGARFTRVNGFDKIFDYEEDILIDIQIKTKSNINETSFTCILKNQLNNELITTLPMSNIECNNNTASFKIFIPAKQLRPGTYPVYLWLGPDSETLYDVLDGLFHLKIATEKTFKDLGFDPIDFGGYFSLKYHIYKIKDR